MNLYTSVDRRNFLFLLTWILSIILPICSAAQEIPIGSWRMHISFGKINAIALAPTKVYGAAGSSLMVFDKTEGSISKITKLDGISGDPISTIGYDPISQKLLVGYNTGGVDIIKGNSIYHFDRLENINIAGSKKINHILFRGTKAYLSTDYGVVVFDLVQEEIIETWRDLGVGGAPLLISSSTTLEDSIYLATDDGVLAGYLQDNLLDYSKWKRYNTNEFATPVHTVMTFNNKIYTAIEGEGIYHHEMGAWIKEPYLDGSNIKLLTASSSWLMLTGENNVWTVSLTDELVEVISDKITNPLCSFSDGSGKIWIGDSHNGMLSNLSGTMTSYKPDGPGFNDIQRLKYGNNKIIALAGGFNAGLQPLGNSGDVSFFSKGQWSNVSALLSDITDIDFSGNTLLISSFGEGLQVGEIDDPDIIYNEDNSSLLNPGNGVRITALENSGDGIWVANYGATQSIHILHTDNTWQAFSFSHAATQYPIELAVDYYGSVWAALNPANGGGLLVFNRYNNEWVRLTESVDNGGLPSRNVRSLALDRNGYMWVGTDDGVAYFPSPSQVFTTPVNAIRPVFESRYLLSGEKITTIAVDGGNRKWMGTEKGVWLFDPLGESYDHNFTSENSPLPSNKMVDIEIDPVSGEVFFATDNGLASFRSDATTEGNFKSVKIFPNPVTSEFSGQVGISGLAQDAYVKITDISGKLIWQTQAHGGTASWNVRDYNGRRAKTGVYLVFSASTDGSDSFVGKLAVIE